MTNQHSDPIAAIETLDSYTEESFELEIEENLAQVITQENQAKKTTKKTKSVASNKTVKNLTALLKQAQQDLQLLAVLHNTWLFYKIYKIHVTKKLDEFYQQEGAYKRLQNELARIKDLTTQDLADLEQHLQQYLQKLDASQRWYYAGIIKNPVFLRAKGSSKKENFAALNAITPGIKTWKLKRLPPASSKVRGFCGRLGCLCPINKLPKFNREDWQVELSA